MNHTTTKKILLLIALFPIITHASYNNDKKSQQSNKKAKSTYRRLKFDLAQQECLESMKSLTGAAAYFANQKFQKDQQDAYNLNPRQACRS